MNNDNTTIVILCSDTPMIIIIVAYIIVKYVFFNNVLTLKIPDILVLLYINLVEHAVMAFTGDVGLHFHSDMPGQY